ncbi:hypothetical protein V8B97DRAFT_1880890 [Scleroderma yunnanense]
MSTRTISGGHILPPNPTYIDFHVSDGDPVQWPENTTRLVDSEGHVNYMRPVPLDESLCIKWRCEVGASLAVQLKKPAGPSYVLRGWPEGYQMFDHNKGPAGNPRHDAYLIGSCHAKRFRSVPEFIPHALWLLTDPTLNRTNCQCKYCNKKPQREITSSMGLLPRRSPLTSTPSTRRPLPIPRASVNSASTSGLSRQARDRANPYAAVRRAPQPIKHAPGPKQHMARERNADLRTAYAEGIELRRWFRDGELLWCALNPPIPGLTGEKDSITFWPGLVEEAKIRSDAIAKSKVEEGDATKKDEPDSTMKDGRSDSRALLDTDPSDSTANEEERRVPWTVVQTLWYKMKLLGIPYSYNIRADQVLPYQAHAPSDELIQAIHQVPLEQMNTDTDSFKPTPSTQFVEAAPPFALAVQIAANLAGYWSPTDDWDYKFTIPPSPPPAKPANDSTSLDSVMNASMTFNASLANAISSFISASPTQTVIQTRYQGLWWGAERIWTDELVRLKLSRSQIAPQGAENILAPAEPSRKAIEYARSLDNGSGESEGIAGAAGRGAFMLIEGLYVVDVPKVNGSSGKECRVSGMLYELVDEDWEEGDGVPGNGGDGNGKDKAIEGSTETGASIDPADGASVDGQSGSQLTDFLATPSKSRLRSPNEQLSRPALSLPFPLPPAPEGFKFRPILTPGYEAVLSLNIIAGRYYPRLLQHPLLDSYVEKALDVESGGLVEASQLWALEGLTPGFYNTMDPERWRPTRVTMVRDADKEARRGLEEHWRTRAREREERRATEVLYLSPGKQLPGNVEPNVTAQAKNSSMQVDAMEVDS